MSLGPTLAEVLQQARALGVDRLDTQMLLSTLLDRPRSWLLTHDDTVLSPEQTERMSAWLARRAAGEPLAYLVGEKEFHGLTLQVSPDVLVPRPDTETLVDWGLELLAGPLTPHTPPTVIDLGTGSGAIALAVKHRHPAALVTALDASVPALAVAEANALRLQLDISLLPSHWWQAVAGRRFHLALSNPPYIAGNDVHLAALHHEPRSALTPEGDGLQCLREIVREARAHLEPGGWLLLEHGYDQADAVTQLLLAAGFSNVQTRTDLAGMPRCTGGCCV
ncbi:MAG: hypothetical protein RLZZ618_3227 [Pseudomonadota bacterium]|jgi:release factor glutamine methyltransferase